MNVRKLKSKMVEHGLNVEKLAKLIGKDRSSLYRKLADNKLTIGEAQKIKDALKMNNNEARDIFFG